MMKKSGFSGKIFALQKSGTSNPNCISVLSQNLSCLYYVTTYVGQKILFFVGVWIFNRPYCMQSYPPKSRCVESVVR
jgi:hypothetical protein